MFPEEKQYSGQRYTAGPAQMFPEEKHNTVVIGTQQAELKCSLKKNTMQLSFKCPSEEKQYIGHWSISGRV